MERSKQTPEARSRQVLRNCDTGQESGAVGGSRGQARGRKCWETAARVAGGRAGGRVDGPRRRACRRSGPHGAPAAAGSTWRCSCGGASCAHLGQGKGKAGSMREGRQRHHLTEPGEGGALWQVLRCWGAHADRSQASSAVACGPRVADLVARDSVLRPCGARARFCSSFRMACDREVCAPFKNSTGNPGTRRHKFVTLFLARMPQAGARTSSAASPPIAASSSAVASSLPFLPCILRNLRLLIFFRRRFLRPDASATRGARQNKRRPPAKDTSSARAKVRRRLFFFFLWNVAVEWPVCVRARVCLHARVLCCASRACSPGRHLISLWNMRLRMRFVSAARARISSLVWPGARRHGAKACSTQGTARDTNTTQHMSAPHSPGARAGRYSSRESGTSHRRAVGGSSTDRSRRGRRPPSSSPASPAGRPRAGCPRSPSPARWWAGSSA